MNNIYRDIMLSRRKKYNDPLNDTIYYCDAKKWSALEDSVRKVTKIKKIKIWGFPLDDEVTSTDGYDNKATDLATVQSLTYR